MEENNRENLDVGAENAEAPSEERESSSIDLARLRKLRKGLRLTQAELATHLGIHRTYLVLIEKGKKIPSPRLERSILEFMDKAEQQGVAPQEIWLQTQSNRPAGPRLVPEVAPRRAPVVSWAAAGSARAYEDLANQLEEVVETECRDANAFAIIIEGDSMEPRFLAGDRVVFTPNSEPRNGDAVVAKLQDGRVLFKYFFRTGPEGIRVKLVSENPNYGPLEFERSELQFIYPAFEVKRRLRR